MWTPDSVCNVLLAQARAGDEPALGRLLELYRDYLRFLARALIGQSLRVRVDASDVVQETFLKASRDFGRFLGSSEPEVTAWLRRIFVRTLANQAKNHRRQSRDYQRQRTIHTVACGSSRDAGLELATTSESPSQQAIQRERSALLSEALEKLPAAYREVFVLRNLDHVPFEEIAARMGRTPGAARVLWKRAMDRLSRMLRDEP